MSTTIDQRVVEMGFDNSQFERGVSQSISTLDRLKAALNLDGAGKSLNEISDAGKNFNLDGMSSAVDKVSDKFSAFETIATGALLRIGAQAENIGIKLLKSLSTDNIAAGWEKFEKKTGSVATLVAQGYALEEVNAQLDRLNWYTDETSYNFTDMVDNISKFTASGQGLTESVDAMMGIANWAALSGQNATKASQAMYQLSQAISKGVLKYDDWKSVQNAGMDNVEFRKNAIQTAIDLGRVKEAAEGVYKVIGGKGEFSLSEMFTSDALSKQGWFDTEVMMETFNKYSSAVNTIYDYIEEQESKGVYITASQAIEELGGSVDGFGVKAFKAAQEARSFTDVINSVKDAVSTGWMKTFEIIFGNYEEATILWSDLANQLWEDFAGGAETRNLVLKAWKNNGGRDALIEGFWNLYYSIKSVTDPIREAFDNVFNLFGEKITDESPIVQTLLKVTNAFKNFTALLRGDEARYQQVREIFEGIWTAVKLVGEAFLTAWYVIQPFANALATIALVTGQLILNAFTAIANAIKGFEASLAQNEGLRNFIENVRNLSEQISQKLVMGFIYLTAIIWTAWDTLAAFGNNLASLGATLWGIFGVAIQFVANVIASFAITVLTLATAALPALSAAIQTVAGWFTSLWATISSYSWTQFRADIDAAVASLSEFLDGKIAQAPAFLQGFLQNIKSFGGTIISNVLGFVDKIAGVVRTFVELFKKDPALAFEYLGNKIRAVGAEILEDVTGFAGNIISAIQGAFETVKNFISDTIGNVRGWFSGIFGDGSEGEASGQDFWQGFLNGITNNPIIQAISSFLQSIGNFFLGVFNAVLGIHSPSTETEWTGRNFLLGFIKGIEVVIGAVIRVVAFIGGQIVTAFNTAIAAIQKTKAYETITHYIDRIRQAFEEGGLAGVYVLFENKVIQIAKAIKGQFDKLAPQVVTAVGNAFTGAKNAIGGFFDSIADTRLGKAVSSIRTKLETLAGTVSTFFETFAGGIFKRAFDGIGNFFNEFVTAFAENGFSGILDLVKKKFTSLGQSIRDFFTKENLTKKIDELGAVFTTVGQTIKNVATTVWNSVKTVFGYATTAFNSITTAISNFFGTIAETKAGTLLGTIAAQFKEFFAVLGGGDENIDKSALGPLGKLADGINNFFGKIKNIIAGVDTLLGDEEFAEKVSAALGLTQLIAIPQIIIAIFVALQGVKKAAKGALGVVDAIKDIAGGIKTITLGIASAMRAFAILGGMSKLLTSFALFLAAFAGAMWVLGQMKEDQMKQAAKILGQVIIFIGVLTLVAGALGAFASRMKKNNTLFLKSESGMESFLQTFAMMAGLGVAVYAVVKAFQLIQGMSVEELKEQIGSVLVMIALMFSLAGSIGLMTRISPTLGKGVFTILAVALSIRLLVQTLKDLAAFIVAYDGTGQLDAVNDAFNGLLVMMALLGVVAGAAGKHGMAAGIGFLAVMYALTMIDEVFDTIRESNVLKYMTGEYWAKYSDQILHGFLALVAVFAAMSLAGKKAIGVGVALVALAFAINSIGFVFSLLAHVLKGISLEDMGSTLGLLGVIFVGIAALLVAVGAAGKHAKMGLGTLAGLSVLIIAITGMIGVFAIMAKIDRTALNDAENVMIAVLGLLSLLVYVTKFTNGWDMFPLIGIVASLLTVCYVIKEIAELKLEKFDSTFYMLVAVFGGLSLIMLAIGGIDWPGMFASIGLVIGVVAALAIVVFNLEKLGTVDADTLRDNVLSIAIALGAVVAALGALALIGQFLNVGIGIVILAILGLAEIFKIFVEAADPFIESVESVIDSLTRLAEARAKLNETKLALNEDWRNNTIFGNLHSNLVEFLFPQMEEDGAGAADAFKDAYEESLNDPAFADAVSGATSKWGLGVDQNAMAEDAEAAADSIVSPLVDAITSPTIKAEATNAARETAESIVGKDGLGSVGAEEGSETAKNVGDGYLNTMSAYEQMMVYQAGYMMDGTMASFQEHAGVNSPSWIMAWIAEMVLAGWNNVMGSEGHTMGDSAAAASEAAMAEMQAAMDPTKMSDAARAAMEASSANLEQMQLEMQAVMDPTKMSNAAAMAMQISADTAAQAAEQAAAQADFVAAKMAAAVDPAMLTNIGVAARETVNNEMAATAENTANSITDSVTSAMDQVGSALAGVGDELAAEGSSALEMAADAMRGVLTDLGIDLEGSGLEAGSMAMLGMVAGFGDPQTIADLQAIATEVGDGTILSLLQALADGQITLEAVCTQLGIDMTSDLAQSLSAGMGMVKSTFGQHLLELASMAGSAASALNPDGEDNPLKKIADDVQARVNEITASIPKGGGGGGGGGGGKGGGSSAKSDKEAAEAAKTHAKAVEYQNKVIEEFTRVYGVAYQQLGETAAVDAAKEAIREMAIEYAKAGEDIEVSEEEIEKAFVEMYDNIHKAIDGSIDMFTRFKVESEGTTRDFINNMKSNLDAADEWANGLERLAARGFSKGLIEALSNEGVKSLGKVRMLLKSSVDDMIEANALWDQKDEATSNAAIKALTAMAYAGKTTAAVLAIASGEIGEAVSDVPAEIVDAYDEWTSGWAALKDLGLTDELTANLKEGVTDAFGNIDLNNRQVLTWTEDTLDQFKDSIGDWVEDVESLPGTISTVLGSSSEYDGVEIAFSPMLQTESGPEVLSQATVDKYIFGLIEEAGENWSSEDLLRLDTKGLEIDGKHINNILADVGETAKTTGEAMHYLGKDGSIARNFDLISTAAEKSGKTFEEYTAEIEKASKAGSAAAKRMQQEIAARVDQINTTYRELKTSIADVISEQMDLFTKFERKTEISGDEMLENMASQVDAVMDWAQGITQLYARGFDEGLVQQIKDLGPKGYETLNAFLDMSEDQIDQANQYYQQSLTAPTDAAAMVSENYLSIATNGLNQMITSMQANQPQIDAQAQAMITGAAAAAKTQATVEAPGVATGFVTELKNNLESNSSVAEAGGETVATNTANATDTKIQGEMSTAGYNADVGLANSVMENSGIVADAGTSLGNVLLNSFYDTVGQGSPWKTMIDSGRFANMGLAQGLDEYSNISITAANETGSSILDSFNNAVADFSTILGDDVDLDPSIRPTLDLTDVEAKSNLLSSMFDSRTMDIAGNINHVGSMNNRMLSALSALQPGNNNNMSVGGITINTQPGQDPQEIANAVSSEIYRRMRSREAVMA